MSVEPELALIIRATLVFLGGSLSWYRHDWLFDPHGLEESAVKRVYIELVRFLESVGMLKLSPNKF